MALKGRKSSTKSPPILSHEFFIQNHADILSCITLVIVVGVMVQATAPWASMFLSVQHNVTIDGTGPEMGGFYYSNGWKDLCTVFFYFLITIVVHAILLEYVLEKISRKLHFSKVRHSQFNETGQLLTFYLISIVWGVDIIVRESYATNIAALWEGYPHIAMTSYFKFFFIVQLAYWLHAYPELYFQKTRREDIQPRVLQASLNFAFIATAYITNYTRAAVCLTVLHYASEAAAHLTLLVDLFRKDENGSQVGQLLSKVVFVLVRLASIILSVLTFWYGLSLSDNQGLDISAGNYNTQFIRMLALGAIGALQGWLMWTFITSQLARMRESSAMSQQQRRKAEKKTPARKQKKQTPEEEVSDLPEVDQNTAHKNIRARSQKAK